MIRLSTLVTGKVAVFQRCRGGSLVYKIEDKDEMGEDFSFTFEVPVSELQGANVMAKEKASTFMRWIRKAHNQLRGI